MSGFGHAWTLFRRKGNDDGEWAQHSHPADGT